MKKSLQHEHDDSCKNQNHSENLSCGEFFPEEQFPENQHEDVA